MARTRLITLASIAILRIWPGRDDFAEPGETRWTPRPGPGEKDADTVIAVNSVGLNSEPLAVRSPQDEPPPPTRPAQAIPEPRNYRFDGNDFRARCSRNYLSRSISMEGAAQRQGRPR